MECCSLLTAGLLAWWWTGAVGSCKEQAAPPAAPQCHAADGPACPPRPHPPAAGKALRANLVQTQPFSSTFGKQATRKKPKLGADSYAELLQQVRCCGCCLCGRWLAAG